MLIYTLIFVRRFLLLTQTFIDRRNPDDQTILGFVF